MRSPSLIEVEVTVNQGAATKGAVQRVAARPKATVLIPTIPCLFF
jgi:hypothetical protein